jgi:hypothetical protein
MTYELVIPGDPSKIYSGRGPGGLVPVDYVLCLAAANTLADSVSEQPLFDVGATAGALTLAAGTYWFDSLISLSGMSATSGNAGVNILGAGTATLAANPLYMIDGSDNAANSIGANVQFTSTAAAAAGPVVTATTGTALQLCIHGTFRVTVAGTLIPSITLATGGVTPAVAIGSYFFVRYLGASDVVTVGPWS